MHLLLQKFVTQNGYLEDPLGLSEALDEAFLTQKTSIWYSAGFDCLVLETPEHTFFIDRGPKSWALLVSILAEKAHRTVQPDTLSAAMVKELKAQYFARGGQIKKPSGQIKLEDLDLGQEI